MATFLVDSNIIIDALNDKRKRHQDLLDLAHAGHILACCPINVAEVCAGMRADEEARTLALLRSLEMYPITFEIAEQAGRLKFEYRSKGKTFSLDDMLVAAVALHYHLSLITDNIKDFPVPQLRLHTLPG
jgi:predicted nucleic acid-binding protein